MKKSNKGYRKRNRAAYLARYLSENPSIVSGLLHKGRIFNILLNLCERLLRKTRLKSKPYMLQIEPICGCNLECPLCPVGNNTMKRSRGLMRYDDYIKIMKPLEDSLIHISFWNWGEPLLHKDIFKMVSYAKKRKIHTLMATNGYFITEKNAKKIIDSGLDEIRISLDGASKKSYERYRKNSDFAKVLKNLTSFVKLRDASGRGPNISLQFIVMKHNQHEIPLMEKIFRKVGADHLLIKTVSAHNDQRGIEDFIPDDAKLSRFSKNIGNLKPKESRVCYLLWRSTVVNWDGTVTACCRDVDAEYSFGNILNQDFSQIWNGGRYISFRKQMLKDMSKLALCRTCSASQERYIEER